MEREGRGRWEWDPSTRDGKEGKEMREGWGARVEKGEGKEGRGGRGNKHTRFKACGAAHVAQHNDQPRLNALSVCLSRHTRISCTVSTSQQR